MKTYTLIIILAIMLHLPNASTAQVNTQDSLALIALYNSTDGANWVNTWNLNHPITNWYGVQIINNRVTRISLHNNNLTGHIPLEIWNLDTLLHLILDYNLITGTIPPEIGNLNKIKTIGISNNNFTGKLPYEIGNLTELYSLDLRNNQFSDTIPDSFCNLINLNVLQLDNNMFCGPMPDSIGKLTSLVEFGISYNFFTSLPSSMSQLSCNNYHLNNNPYLDSLPQDMFINFPTTGYNKVIMNNCNIKNLPNPFPSYLYYMIINDNRLTFGDLEPVFSAQNHYDQLSLSPQDSICNAIDTTIHIGDTITLETITDGQFNVYNWKKDGFTIINNNSQELIINGVTLNDAGVYTCEVTNTLVTDLTLNRRLIILRVDTTTYAQIDKKFDNIFINYNPETQRAIFTGTDLVDKITIYDMAGKMVCKKNATTLPLEITLPQRGSYIAHITAKGKNKVLKF